MLTYAAPSIPNPYEDAAVSQALVYIHADDRETKQLQKEIFARRLHENSIRVRKTKSELWKIKNDTS